MTTIEVKSSKMDAIIGQDYLFLPIAKIKNLIDNHRGKIEQDGCNNQSRTDYCTIFHPSDYFQQGLLKEIQCPVVHPLHVWNSFLKLNR